MKTVKELFYLDDMTSGQSNAILAVSVRIAAFWTKWRQVSPLLLNKKIDMITKCHIYGACLQLSLIYCSKTWPQNISISSSLMSADMELCRGLQEPFIKTELPNEAVIKMTGLLDPDKLQLQ